MKLLLFLLLPLGLSACALLEWSGAGIVLDNRTDEPIYYLAMELEESYRVDLIPYLPYEENPFPRINPNESRVVADIRGYEPGDDVVFILYTEGKKEGARIIQLTRLLTVTARQLRRSPRVIIDSLEQDEHG